MGYLAYRRDAQAHDLAGGVQVSELESRASGVGVGRLDIWPMGAVSGIDARRMILDAGLDVVIVRHSAQDVPLAAQLQCEELIVLQADTLLYFEICTDGAPAEGGAALRVLGSDDAAEVEGLVGEVFADYRNHWSANPLMRAINVCAAYQDWALRCLATPGLSVMKAVTADGGTLGMAIVDERDAEVRDILLAGVLPDHRRQGAYQAMMRAIISRAAAHGVPTVAISTQAANVGVMRAWCRMGMLPTVALNTLHVIRRDRFPSMADA